MEAGCIMPNVLIKRGDEETIEVTDLTFEQVKELVGLNGHRRISRRPTPEQVADVAGSGAPDYHKFFLLLSDKGKKFFEIIRQYPSGVEAKPLSNQLGFTSANQIGGLAGGGLAKLAKKSGVRLSRLYTSEVRFTNGVRERMFKPGKDISQLQ